MSWISYDERFLEQPYKDIFFTMWNFIINETFIFFKIVPLPFNTFIPSIFPFVVAPMGWFV